MKVNYPISGKPRIEMLPLIDIVFLLLVFFIYAMLSMAVHRGLPVELPASSSAMVEKESILSITVRADGSVFLDKASVKIGTLTAELKRQPLVRRQSGVMLFADKGLPYQRLFNILDQIRKAGISNISLQAEAERVP
jgi:biopolymer transport protein ExbD